MLEKYGDVGGFYYKRGKNCKKKIIWGRWLEQQWEEGDKNKTERVKALRRLEMDINLYLDMNDKLKGDGFQTSGKTE